ncbi:DUF4386 family protein [Neobacillus sp. FSL H8-0543]|uniref:DUF4386 family protein n=1 Tax=Neobacillus sp. FSL H8-0543 TaxID=2954672 RepID=UPI0031584B24
MNSNKKAEKIVGVLFIAAAVTAVMGLILKKPILNGPNYLINGAEHDKQVILAVVMELLLVVTAIGTATTMFPILRKYIGLYQSWV